MTVHSGPTALFGAALDTSNLGVRALATSVIEGFARHAAHPDLVVFDNGWGHRTATMQSGEDKLNYRLAGARLSRRYHRPESLQTMYALAPLRGLGNSNVRLLRKAPAILDVSGGDSFTDMYGPQRFRQVELPKKLALRLKRPLLLLPQTYGPFRDRDTLARATAVIRGAHHAWARDEQSYAVLADILRDDFDASRHKLGVDMAFGLTPSPNNDPEHAELRDWIRAAGRPLAGVNISGLLWSTLAGKTRDELQLDYRQVMSTLIQKLAASGAKVLLVPHVISTRVGSESDVLATRDALQQLNVDPEQVRILPTAGLTAAEAKWWISQCDWFVGARMHATIAALSTGVPTTALAYSLKTSPVFATLGLASQVIDARASDTGGALEFLWTGWLERERIRRDLLANISRVKKAAEAQMIDITAQCDALAAAS